MTMFLRALSRAAVFVAAVLVAATAAAQQSTTLTDLASSESSITPGWSLTPGLLLSRTYDDNVLLRGSGDPAEHDYVNIVNPTADVIFNGPHATFSAMYDGALVAYSNLSTLNSYNQRASLNGKQQLSKRLAFVVEANAAAAPTTEFLQISGIPFVRTGVFTDCLLYTSD